MTPKIAALVLAFLLGGVPSELEQYYRHHQIECFQDVRAMTYIVDDTSGQVIVLPTDALKDYPVKCNH